jgi:hypothetical protein
MSALLLQMCMKLPTTKIPVRVAGNHIIHPRPYATKNITLRKPAQPLPVLLYKKLDGSLLSIGQIVNAIDSRAIFESCYITRKGDNKRIQRGTRC